MLSIKTHFRAPNQSLKIGDVHLKKISWSRGNLGYLLGKIHIARDCLKPFHAGTHLPTNFALPLAKDIDYTMLKYLGWCISRGSQQTSKMFSQGNFPSVHISKTILGELKNAKRYSTKGREPLGDGVHKVELDPESYPKSNKLDVIEYQI